jgi:hypothetical protein
MISRLLGKALTMSTLGLLASTAAAQEAGPFEAGWYLGAGLSYNDVYLYDDTCWGCYGSAEYGNGDASGLLTAGFRANRFLAIEGSYVGRSSLRWNRNLLMFDDFFEPYIVDADIDLSSYQLSVLGIAAGRYWELYLRVGVAFWDAQSDLTVTRLTTGIQLPRSLDRRGEDFLLGIGGGWAFGRSWQLRLDYAYFPIDDELLASGVNHEAYSDYAALQIIKRFGSD